MDETERSGGIHRRRALIGVAAAGAACVGGVLGWRALSDARSVTLGGSLPLSGPRRDIGVPLRRGLRLWAETTNDRGGLRGRRIDLNVVDDGGDPDEAREAYGSLVADSDLLASPYGSPATEAIVDDVERAGVPCVAHTAGDPSTWADGRDWLVQLLNPVDTFLHSTLEAAEHAGAGSVGFVHRTDGFTPATVDGAREEAESNGWTITDVVTYDSADDIDAAVEQAAAAEPDLLVGSGFRPGEAGGGFLPDALALARAYDRTAGEADLVCWSIGASFAEFGATLGEQAYGAVGATGWKPYVGYPDNRWFVDRYEDRWGSAADSHAAQGYATGQLFEAAVARAGTLAAGPLRDALFELRTETVFGRYQVDDRGLQVGKANAVVQWQDGEPVVVGPDRWRDGDLVYPATSG